MLDVHAPHERVHGWRDFVVHLCTITVGLLIALTLEATAEWTHHRREVAETREALRSELVENQRRFAQDTTFSRREAATLQHDLLVLRYQQSGATASSLPGVVALSSSYQRMDDAAWKTAQATGVTAFMPQEEVRRTSELYSFFDRMDRVHEDEADAIAEAVSFMAQNPDQSHLSPTQLQLEIDLFQHVLAKHLRHGFLMQNLAEENSTFRPSLSHEELDRWIHPIESKIQDAGPSTP